MFASLAREDRLRLMKFVCSVAWADLEVHREERAFVRRMTARLALRPDEVAQVDEWLRVPPSDVDPEAIPREQERASLALLEDLLKAED